MWGHNVNEVREIADLRGETQVLFHGRLATNETSPKKKKKKRLKIILRHGWSIASFRMTGTSTILT